METKSILASGLFLAGAAVAGGLLAILVTDADPGGTPTVLATALVALPVAGITAVTTDRRQDRQLAEEKTRLSMGFAQERVMHDLAELRGVMGEALAVAVKLAGKDFTDLTVSGRLDDAARRKSLEGRWWGYAHEALAQHTRLELRLGREHVVTETYGTAYEEFTDCVTDIGLEPPSDEDEASLTQGLNRYEKDLAVFAVEARKLIGTAREITGEAQSH